MQGKLWGEPGKLWSDPGIISGAASPPWGSSRTRGEPEVRPEAAAHPRAWQRSPPSLRHPWHWRARQERGCTAAPGKRPCQGGCCAGCCHCHGAPPAAAASPGAAGLPAPASAEQPAGTCGFVFDRKSQDNSVVVALLRAVSKSTGLAAGPGHSVSPRLQPLSLPVPGSGVTRWRQPKRGVLGAG